MERPSRNAPNLLLAAALAASGALTVFLTRHLTFYQDTWAYLITRRQLSFEAVLKPHNEHIVAIPVLIEQLFLRVFGMGTARPEYVLLAVALAVTAWLFFLYVSRRVGPWLALLATVALLALGPAWEVLLWPFELCFVGSVLFGIATLLALERGDRLGDIGACVLLILSLGSSSLGVVFLIAALVAVAQGRPGTRVARAWVVVIPAVLFLAWYVGWGHEAESHVSLRNAFASPRYVVEGLSASLASLLGLGASPYGDPVDSAWGLALLIALAIGLAYRQLRRPGFSAGLWPAAAALAAYWFLAALNQFPGREAVASRYQYAGAVLLMMVIANLQGEVRLRGRALIAAVLATAVVVGPNLVVLKDAQVPFEEQSVLTRADTAAIEIARRTVPPDFQLNPEIAGTPSLINVIAGPYLEAVEEFGSPAYTPAELAAASEPGRRAADLILSQALPVSRETRPGAYQPDSAAENCVAAGDSGPPEVRLSPGITRIELAPGPPADIALRRFAVGEYPATSNGIPGGSVTILRVPRDEAPRQPWYLHVEARQAVRVCR